MSSSPVSARSSVTADNSVDAADTTPTGTAIVAGSTETASLSPTAGDAPKSPAPSTTANVPPATSASTIANPSGPANLSASKPGYKKVTSKTTKCGKQHSANEPSGGRNMGAGMVCQKCKFVFCEACRTKFNDDLDNNHKCKRSIMDDEFLKPIGQSPNKPGVREDTKSRKVHWAPLPANPKGPSAPRKRKQPEACGSEPPSKRATRRGSDVGSSLGLTGPPTLPTASRQLRPRQPQHQEAPESAAEGSQEPPADYDDLYDAPPGYRAPHRRAAAQQPSAALPPPPPPPPAARPLLRRPYSTNVWKIKPIEQEVVRTRNPFRSRAPGPVFLPTDRQNKPGGAD